MKPPTFIRMEKVTVKSVSNTGQDYMALQSITLKINQGERIGIIGRNGSGKTTLARLLVGLDHPTQGKIVANLTRMLVMQRPENHFNQNTVHKEIARYLPKSARLAEVAKLMQELNLPQDLKNISLHHISSGQQRLVAIACALARNPNMLILDEPMAGLDAINRAKVAEALRNLVQAQAIGLCIISHHPDDLIGLVDRLCVLDNGNMLYDGAFSMCPTASLDKCLSLEDISVYRWIRELTEKGNVIPPSLYDEISENELRNLLNSMK